MRIAVAKATLQVPPTYFAVQHAMALRDAIDFRFFAAAAEVTDQGVLDRLDVQDVSRQIPVLRARSYAFRQRLAPGLDIPVARAIARWRPDVIHQHFANLSGAAVRAHHRTGAPLLLTVHGADVFLPLTDPSTVAGAGGALLIHHQRTVARAFAEAASILAVSEYLAGRAIAGGAPPERVQVHYQGIDTEAYSPADSAETRHDPPRVVFVGALSDAKGVRDLLQASLRMLPQSPHRLVLAGDGPLRGMLELAAAEHPHLEVLGAVDRERVREVLDGAAVLVLPTRLSQGRREAAGLVTLEAQSMKVPVVVYDSGGAAEMLRDGDTGLLVTEGDVAGLADAIRQIVTLSGPDHRAMGERARRFVVEERSLAASARRLSEIYQETTR